MIRFIDTEIVKGVNFLKVSEGLASLNYREYLQRRRIYSSTCENAVVNVSDSLEFNNNTIYSFPSNVQGITGVYRELRVFTGITWVYKGLQQQQQQQQQQHLYSPSTHADKVQKKKKIITFLFVLS